MPAQKCNLDGLARDTQLRMGVVMVALALGLAVISGHLGVGRLASALLFVPFFGGAYGVLAGLYGVCGVSALRGKRITGGETSPVADSEQRATLQNFGAKVLASSALCAAIATLLVVVGR